MATNDKRRFAFSRDGTHIRANQGHSVEVDLKLVAVEPPTRLFHGTAPRFLDSIRSQGLVAGARHHVHLSATRDVAEAVGRRRGEPVVLTVAALDMAHAGHVFFQSANGVWLVAAVPPEFCQVIE